MYQQQSNQMGSSSDQHPKCGPQHAILIVMNSNIMRTEVKVRIPQSSLMIIKMILQLLIFYQLCILMSKFLALKLLISFIFIIFQRNVLIFFVQQKRKFHLLRSFLKSTTQYLKWSMILKQSSLFSGAKMCMHLVRKQGVFVFLLKKGYRQLIFITISMTPSCT